jgi:ABC-2 type transport system permease protein
MLTVAKNEFFKNLKSIKSILIILLFACLSFFMTRYLKGIIKSDLNGLYSTLKFLVFILGYLFVSTISHDVINREIEMQTIRLIVTKISKKRFLIGKLIGIIIFWFICIFISFSIISISAKMFNIMSFLLIFSCIYYYSCCVIFLSTIINKSTISNFLGIFLGLLLPPLGIYLTTTTNFLKLLKWLFPYVYIEKSGFYILGPIVIGTVFILISLKILEKKDV